MREAIKKTPELNNDCLKQSLLWYEHYLPGMDPKAISDAVNDMLANPQKAIEMGKAGRKLVETKYDWGNIVKQVLELYDEGLTKKKGA